MSERADELVAEFLERREDDPTLTPGRFASEHPGLREELLPKLQRVVDVETLFPDPAFARPETIGPWRVLGELGRGGAGRVLRVVGR